MSSTITQRMRAWLFPCTVAALAICAAIGLPVASQIGIEQIFQATERNVAMGYARDVLQRSERVSATLKDALAQLTQGNPATFCDPSRVTTMRRIALMSPDIMAIGHSQQGRLLCSSLPVPVDSVVLGPVEFRGEFDVRTKVSLPLAPSPTFMAIERDGFVFFLYRTHVIDLPLDRDAVVATYSTLARRVRTSRGEVRPAWLAAGRRGQGVSFIDGRYAVAVLESSRNATGVVVAYPRSRWQSEKRSIAGATLGLAILAGLGVASWVVLWARRLLSVSATSLKRGLRRGEFSLHYQPIVELETGRWVGVEALLRWQRPGGTPVSPAIFVPLAERTGLIARLSQRVLELVTAESPMLLAEDPDFYIAINLAGSDLASSKMLTRLRALSELPGASGRNFQVEITEYSMVSIDAAGSSIKFLREMGIQVVLDDFGTGFSNLGYLTEFALDGLKIDQQFVQRIGRSDTADAMVFHIIELARSFGLRIVAEGIETQQQADALAAHGVRRGQGWLFARPMPLHELLKALRRRHD